MIVMSALFVKRYCKEILRKATFLGGIQFYLVKQRKEFIPLELV